MPDEPALRQRHARPVPRQLVCRHRHAAARLRAAAGRGQGRCLCRRRGLYRAVGGAASGRGGLDVVLLEAQRVGFGASGRNGGQLGSASGWNRTVWKRWWATRCRQALGAGRRRQGAGQVADRKARDRLRSETRRRAHGFRPPRPREHARYADHLHTRYGYDEIERWTRTRCRRSAPRPPTRAACWTWARRICIR